MTKKHKIWLCILVVIFIMDIIMHFTAYSNSVFGSHLNYIATVLMGFTLGLEVAEIPRFKGV